MPLGEFFPRWQRVAPTGGSACCGPVSFGAECGVQVGIHRAGDMGLLVLGQASVRLGQVKAAVKHHARCLAREKGLQFLDRDQGGVGHGVFEKSGLWIIRFRCPASWGRRKRRQVVLFTKDNDSGHLSGDRRDCMPRCLREANQADASSGGHAHSSELNRAIRGEWLSLRQTRLTGTRKARSGTTRSRTPGGKW